MAESFVEMAVFNQEGLQSMSVEPQAMEESVKSSDCFCDRILLLVLQYVRLSHCCPAHHMLLGLSTPCCPPCDLHTVCGHHLFGSHDKADSASCWWR